MTPHDFHWMIGLRSHGLTINLDGELSIQLAIDLLRHAYLSEGIRYFDLERDYKPLSQATLDDCAQMARALLLYVVGAYLFANEGQTISLRWLALFYNF